MYYLKCDNVPSVFTCNEYRGYCATLVYLHKNEMYITLINISTIVTL